MSFQIEDETGPADVAKCISKLKIGSGAFAALVAAVTAAIPAPLIPGSIHNTQLVFPTSTAPIVVTFGTPKIVALAPETITLNNDPLLTPNATLGSVTYTGLTPAVYKISTSVEASYLATTDGTAGNIIGIITAGLSTTNPALGTVTDVFSTANGFGDALPIGTTVVGNLNVNTSQLLTVAPGTTLYPYVIANYTGPAGATGSVTILTNGNVGTAQSYLRVSPLL
jgi:hypothetical protein